MKGRDHDLNECEEIVESESGYYTVRRCEACRKQMYSIASEPGFEWREPANERTIWDRIIDFFKS